MPAASAIVDEPAHIAAGWIALTQGDLRVNREHPPLAKVAAAAALLPLAPATPAEAPGGPSRASEDFSFGYSREFLYRANDHARLLMAARLPIVALTILGAALLALWGRRLFGGGAAVAALALFAFEPNLLAHGRLVTTDMAASVFLVATLAAFERALSPGSGRRWTLAAALAFGLALLSRFSCLLIVPCLAAAAALDRRLPARPRAARAALILAGGILVVQAGYGDPSLFALAAPPAGGPLVSEPFASMEASPTLRWLPMPLPRLYLEGLDLARYKNAQVEGPGYLNGELSRDGWWSYFVLALGMKGTIPWLFLAAAGLALMAGGAKGAGRIPLVYVALPALGLLLLTTAMTRAQIGLRYILPVVPLLCLAGGHAAARLAAARLPGLAVALALLGWHAREAAAIAPYHLAYFNQAAGGPQNGWRRLVDSNLDWGQDLPGLARFMAGRGLSGLNLYYFGTADPQAHGIIRQVPPRPGWFAISATHLAGVYLPDPGYFADFRARVPDAAIGHSILLYRLDEVPPSMTSPPRAR